MTGDALTSQKNSREFSRDRKFWIMAKILILYGTNSGQTRKVSERIAQVLVENGHETEVIQGIKAPKGFSPESYDAAVIGTSIYMGQHQIAMKKLVKTHQEAFDKIPTAYFCVCLTAKDNSERSIAEVQKYLKDFTSYTGLKPAQSIAVAGALKYPDYNFIKRFSVKLLARKLGLDTDTKKYFEYTDWDAVDHFATEFANSL